MASAKDTENRKNGNSEEEQNFNQRIAEGQGDKTAFRAQKTAVNADPFASGRLPIKEDRY
jgi:hypothetical protein